MSAVSTFAILVPSLGGTLGIMGGFCFIFIGALNGCDVWATDSRVCRSVIPCAILLDLV